MRGEPAQSERQLGFWMALALVVGNIIGSGIFLLPANLAPPRTPESTVVVLVLDKSSSMEGRKMDLARQSAMGVVDNLREVDQVGVLAFDNTFEWAIPVRANDDPRRLKQTIAGIIADGGTQIAPALKEAYEQIQPRQAVYRHILLLTDGEDTGERARTEILRLAGIEQSELRARHDVVFAVRRCEVDYRRPARLDDLVEVRSRLTRVRGAQLSAAQSIWRAGEELVRLVVDLAALRGDGRPTRIPAPVRAALEPFVQPLEQG